jgi:hypothetical protein
MSWLADRQQAFHIVQGVVFAVAGAGAVSFFWLRFVVAPA